MFMFLKELKEQFNINKKKFALSKIRSFDFKIFTQTINGDEYFFTQLNCPLKDTNELFIEGFIQKPFIISNDEEINEILLSNCEYLANSGIYIFKSDNIDSVFILRKENFFPSVIENYSIVDISFNPMFKTIINLICNRYNLILTTKERFFIFLATIGNINMQENNSLMNKLKKDNINLKKQILEQKKANKNLYNLFLKQKQINEQLQKSLENANADNNASTNTNANTNTSTNIGTDTNASTSTNASTNANISTDTEICADSYTSLDGLEETYCECTII